MRENFSKGIRNILKLSKEEAIRLKQFSIGPEHLLLGIIKDKDGQANKMLRSLGCDIKEMRLMVEDLTANGKENLQNNSIQLNRNADKILRNTFEEASKSNRKIANQIDLFQTDDSDEGSSIWC